MGFIADYPCFSVNVSNPRPPRAGSEKILLMLTDFVDPVILCFQKYRESR
ncbi:Uncharacterized protein dnm_098510 [Desulfonema magnum]|uniref:Uncharacterized protein n=1 Tax=Desulfonema magnum TaxID=45655 RepID=A0A975GU74_9BACT|nr:Uncharacterized protein dnm_098510 [Desulfonema magnum]